MGRKKYSSLGDLKKYIRPIEKIYQKTFCIFRIYFKNVIRFQGLLNKNASTKHAVDQKEFPIFSHSIQSAPRKYGVFPYVKSTKQIKVDNIS